MVQTSTQYKGLKRSSELDKTLNNWIHCRPLNWRWRENKKSNIERICTNLISKCTYVYMFVFSFKVYCVQRRSRLSSCLIGIFPKTIRVNAHVYPWHFYRRNLGHSPELLLRDDKILMEFSTLVKQKIVVLLMLLVNTIGGLNTFN